MAPLATNTLCSDGIQYIPAIDSHRLLSAATDDKMHAFHQPHQQQQQQQEHHWYHHHGPLSPLGVEKKHEQLDTPVIRSSHRGVSFSSTIQVNNVPHFTDYTEEESMSLWLTANDWQEIKDGCRDTLRLMMSRTTKIPRNDENHCPRGLEMKTTTAARQRHAKRSRARKTVLLAQEFQQREGISDPLYLAELYAARTASSQTEAYRQGLSDELDATL